MPTYAGAFTTPGTSAEINLVLDVSVVSQSIQNNTTSLTWNLYMHEHVNANPWRATANSSAVAVVGNTVYSSGSLSYDFRGTNAVNGIASGSITVTHNPDGTKTIPIQASFADGGNIIGNASISTSLTLTAIPRNRAKVGVGGSWKTAEVFVGVNGEWKMAEVFVGVGGAWKRVDPS